MGCEGRKDFCTYINQISKMMAPVDGDYISSIVIPTTTTKRARQRHILKTL